jgi:hypothetical protein
MSTKRLVTAIERFNAMTKRAQPQKTVKTYPQPDLTNAFIVDVFSIATTYNGDPFGTWTFNPKSHRIDKLNQAYVTVSATHWSTPAAFDKAVIKMFNMAAEQFEMGTNLALAYRMEHSAFNFPEKAFRVVCHPDNKDAIKNYYESDKLVEILTTRACKTYQHYVIPYHEFLGVLLQFNNFEMYNVMINPRVVARVKHVGGYKASMDSFTEKRDDAIKFLLGKKAA